MNAQFLQSIRTNALGPSARAHIDLSNNFLRPRDLENFVKAIQKNIAKNPEILCPILSITLTGNEICGMDEFDEGEYDYRGLKILSSTIVQKAKVFKLRKLVLSRNRIGKRGFGFINALIAGNHAITDLILRDCAADEECLDQFIESVEKSKGLVLVDLACNPIDAGGAALISRSMRLLKRLRTLDLSNCKLGPSGIKFICDGMCSNYSIQILFLSSNDAGDDGAAAIGTLLKENSVLLHLDIQNNKISSTGVGHIGDGLLRNKSLQGLALQWNDVGPHGALHLAECIRGNSTLKTLFVFGNRIDADTAATLASSPVGGPLELDVKYKPIARRKSVAAISIQAESPVPDDAGEDS